MANAWVWAIRRDVGRNFQITKTAESAPETLKKVTTKQPFLERENLIIRLFRLFLYGREPRRRCASRLLRIKPGKEFAKRLKKKSNKELKTKTTRNSERH